METEKFEAPKGLIGAVAEYLMDQPYKEVSNLIRGLEVVRALDKEDAVEEQSTPAIKPQTSEKRQPG